MKKRHEIIVIALFVLIANICVVRGEECEHDEKKSQIKHQIEELLKELNKSLEDINRLLLYYKKIANEKREEISSASGANEKIKIRKELIELQDVIITIESEKNKINENKSKLLEMYKKLNY